MITAKVLHSYKNAAGLPVNQPLKTCLKDIKFIIAHFALNCNSAFRSDLYFRKGFSKGNSTEEKEVNQ